MRIDVFTLFPDMVEGFAGQSLLGKARQRGLLDVRVHDLRAQTTDVHRTVDDAPFGGGAGMVLMPEPVFAAVEAVDPPRPLLLLGPGGRRFDQAMARELSASSDGFSLLCGRYEGVDERVRDHLVRRRALDRRLRARRRRGGGDGRARGGRAGCCRASWATRRRPTRSPSPTGLLEYPHYTRPAEFRGWAVPEVLRSGDHAEIARWRRAQALARTIAGPARSGRRRGRLQRRRAAPVGGPRHRPLRWHVPRGAL